MFVGLVFNIIQVLSLIFFLVLFCYLCSIDPSSWVTLTAFLVAFVFLGGLGLNLGLRLTYISKKKIVKLNFVSISMVPTEFIFFYRFVAFLVPSIDFFCS